MKKLPPPVTPARTPVPEIIQVRVSYFSMLNKRGVYLKYKVIKIRRYDSSLQNVYIALKLLTV